MLRVICSLMLSSFVLVAAADDTLKKSAETFEVQGHKAFLYAAPTPAVRGTAPSRQAVWEGLVSPDWAG